MLFMSISIALGLTFIFSGYTKLFPIEPFELTFIDLRITRWKIAPFFARFIIGLEFFIGLILILGLYFKRLSLKVTIITLTLFSIYLIFILTKNGNNGNCGCFGNFWVFTPFQALVKNIIMLIFSFLLLKNFEGINYKEANKYLVISFILAFGTPYIINRIDLDYSNAYLTKKENYFKLELDSLYRNASIHAPPKTLQKGKHILVFMSLTCGHCRTAAKKLRLMKKENPALPVYFILNGDTNNIKPFFEDTKAYNINYSVLNGKSFVYLVGFNVPRIFLINNSIVENWINYQALQQNEIEKWLGQN